MIPQYARHSILGVKGEDTQGSRHGILILMPMTQGLGPTTHTHDVVPRGQDPCVNSLAWAPTIIVLMAYHPHG